MQVPRLAALLLACGACSSHPRLAHPPVAAPPGAELLRGRGGVDLYTSTVGPGTRGVVWYVLGPETPAAPPYPRLTAALHAAGLATFVAHARGSGYSEGLRGDVDDYGLVLSDDRLFLEHLAARFTTIVVMGHSVGAALALEVAATTPTPLAGVVLVNPAWKLRYGEGMGPTARDYVVFAFDAIFRRSALTVDMNRAPWAIRFGPDREEALAMQRDPLVVRYFSLRYLSAERRVARRCAEHAAHVRAPLLLVQGSHDALVDPDSFDALLAAVAVADKRKLVALEGGHGSSAVETMVPALVEWISAHAGPG